MLLKSGRAIEAYQEHMRTWHRWYAWYPVPVRVLEDGSVIKAWMQEVERRFHYKGCGDDGPCWDPEYRIITTAPPAVQTEAKYPVR